MSDDSVSLVLQRALCNFLVDSTLVWNPTNNNPLESGRVYTAHNYTKMLGKSIQISCVWKKTNIASYNRMQKF